MTRRWHSQCALTLAATLILATVGPAWGDETLEGDSVEAPEADSAADSPEASANVFELPETGVDIVGEVRTVEARQEDTLLDIGRRHGLGYREIRRANPDVDVWLPGEGTEITLPLRFVLPPGPREGIVVNLPEMRLYHFPEPGPDGTRVVETYPISIGRMDWSSPIGETRVTHRLEDPAWYPPDSVRARYKEEGRELPRRVDPGPDNPLGRHAIGLDIPGYFIHGTNRPAGVGMQATHGCIRMFPEDIESLVHRVDRGTPVRILNATYKAGWSQEGELYLQAYPALEIEGQERNAGTSAAVRAVADAVEDRPARVDYPRLRTVAERGSGRPSPITREESPRSMARAD